MKYPKIILASASPRRKELLNIAGIEYSVVPADVDESVLTTETAREMVLRLAEAKARKVSESYAEDLVLAADTTVVIDDQILGKPVDVADAQAILHKLQGKWHSVLSAVCLINLKKNYFRCECYQSKVKFVDIASTEIEEYVATGEPLDKAGAYAFQGIGMKFIEQIEGSPSSIIGLDIAKLLQILKDDQDRL